MGGTIHVLPLKFFMGSDLQITRADKRVIQSLLSALKPLNDLSGRGSLPLPYAMAFLVVACDEGKPLSFYASKMDMNRFVISRCMHCIGDRGRGARAGLGLVTIRQTGDYPVRTEVLLTAKGREFAATILRHLRPRSRLKAQQRTAA
jgi:hypothetical protein